MRIWDPATGLPLLKIPVYSVGLDITYANNMTAVAMQTGLLAIEISDPFKGST